MFTIRIFSHLWITVHSINATQPLPLTTQSTDFSMKTMLPPGSPAKLWSLSFMPTPPPHHMYLPTAPTPHVCDTLFNSLFHSTVSSIMIRTLNLTWINDRTNYPFSMRTVEMFKQASFIITGYSNCEYSYPYLQSNMTMSFIRLLFLF